MALAGVDTRALTSLIRKSGMPNAVIAHSPDGAFDLDALRAEAARWHGIDGTDLVPQVGATQRYDWDETSWTLEHGYGHREETRFHVVAVDYGVKRNILRLLNDVACAVTVVPATASAEDILALKPDGIFLSNGPGDPAATGEYAVPMIHALLDLPASSASASAISCSAGGRRAHGEDASRPSRREPSGEGTHDRQGRDRLPEGRLRSPGEPAGQCRGNPRLAVRRLERRLPLTDRPVFAVQYHPEASPGPRDSHYLFRRFADMMAEAKKGAA